MNNKKYFIDENGKAYTGDYSNGLWRLSSADDFDRLVTMSIKHAGMKEVSFDDWIKAQQKQGA